MPDANVKISELSTVTSTAAQGTNVLPIVNSSQTKAISFNELRTWLATNGGGGPQGTAGNQGTTGAPGGGTAGAYYEKRYQRTNAVPSAPAATPYPPAGWSTTIPSGNQVLWSTSALINAAGSALETGTWSTPVRESSGNVVFYQASEPSAAYILEGDSWYDIDDNNKLYRYVGTFGSGGSWQAAFTPFPGIDASGNVTGLVKATGTNATFAIIADKFQIIDPADPGGGNAIVPFEVVGGQVYMQGAHIINLDAGVITGGEITAAITLQTPLLKAGVLTTGSSLCNINNTGNTMPVIAYGRYEGNNPYTITAGPNNSDGTPDWLSGDCTFIGWSSGSAGYEAKRFGKTTMIFSYTLEAYASDLANGINLNVVYQVNSGSVEQAQFPQADTVDGDLRLSQSGTVMLTGLTGSDTVKFGIRGASTTSSGSITYAQLTVLAYNL